MKLELKIDRLVIDAAAGPHDRERLQREVEQALARRLAQCAPTQRMPQDTSKQAHAMSQHAKPQGAALAECLAAGIHQALAKR